ncbi:hypothetical protein LTR66_008006 [Elasticomyces elasticus]|nr:hypothetical protein LTR66_008006 [Elasticomyces elasticus]KAK5006021.1 hypothetical protein LTR28_006993 [Elasticomyces elasticus]
MPGWSLWLVPPEHSSLHAALTTLITTTLPSLFPNTDHPAFHPHVTLTADVPPSTFAEADPQAWLDGLALPEEGGAGIDVVVGGVEVGESFVKKLTLKVEEDGGLVELAVWCRAGAIFGGDFERARSSTTPPSTLTAALTTKILPAVSTAKQAATSTAAITAADQTPDPQAVDQNSQQRERERELQERNSWRGISSVWLVPTALPVGEWTAVARREVGGVVWVWE